MKRLLKYIVLTGLMIAAVSCRNDSAPEKRIEKIAFSESAKTLYVGDMVTIGLVAEPKEARSIDTVSYQVTESGIIEIKEGSGNDGVVIKGIARGNTIITAKVNGIVDYCSITVLGGGESVIPHITVPEYTMELQENQRRSIVASLVGGNPTDNNGFVWTYTNQQVISLEATGNIAIFDTLRTGESIITISHPKAQFGVNVLVYVGGIDEIPVYITTDSNVINVKTTDSNYQYEVSLRGGDSGDQNGFTHKILEGSDVISLSYNNNIGTINPKARGAARIGISHTKASHELTITVIVNESIEYHYIDVNKTLIVMEEGNIDYVIAEFVGDVSQDVLDRYSYEIEDTSVINVIQSHNNFAITGLRKGKSILTIKNTYADFGREVLVVVNGITSIIDNEVYITTNQNVITTQIGADNVILAMQLMGGNEADRNNFVWTVDDGTIIEVESAHGKVNYQHRSMVSNIGSQFEAQAVITAKKVGTATITLENPKAQNTLSVIVKVYAKGTFSAVPVVIGGPSLYTLGIGEEMPLSLGVVTGSATSVTNIEWKSENSAVVRASGSGLSGVLKGITSGVTTITVTGNNLKHDYSALVVVGNTEYLNSMPYLYVTNPFTSVIKGQSTSFKIICENMSEAEIHSIQVVNNSGDIVDVFAYRNSVMVTGLELGDAELIISSPGLNTVRVVIRVEDYAINPDMPYYLNSGKSIYGVVKGKDTTITVNLVGGSTVNAQNIVWSIENGNVADMSANGSTAIVRGKSAGQTVITVRHAKSHNELEIFIYVVESESELDNVVIYVKEKNVLLNVGEMRYLSITTNANDSQRNGFQWNISNFSVIDYSISSDRLKAYISAREAGNATITIKYNDATVPAVIYISVINAGNGVSYINVPSIIEMVSGDTLKVNAVSSNVSNISMMQWSGRDSDIITVRGNGDTCLIDALRSGNTVITVEHSQSGFKKDILVYVYDSISQVGNEYIIAGEQSRYVISKGDIINVGLLFGMKGFPEYELLNIRWTASGNNVVSVTGNGKTATVKGQNVGIGTVTASSGIANTVEIEIEVREEAARAGQYWFSIDANDRMKGIVCGSSTDIGIRVYNGNNEVFNVSGIEYIVEKSDIISVTDNGNTIRVFASNNAGQSYITLRHDYIEEAKILIYTATSEYGLSSYYPIMVTRQNYLLKIGESKTITIETKDNDTTKLNNIHYYLENSNTIITLQEKNKKEIVITANAPGSNVVLIRYNGEVVQRIYVSVTEGNYSASSAYLVTESIIGMVVGTEYETVIQTDVVGTVSWRSDDYYTASIVSYSGKTAVIRGNGVGRTTVTVSVGETERTVLVVVCETKEELAGIQAINIEQRKFKIRTQDSLSISVQSYQGKIEGETRYGDYYGYSPLYGGVIEVISSENGRLNIWGTAEGVATIRVTNSFYDTEILVYIEVYSAGEGGTEIVSKDVYITSAKTLYVIGMDEQNVPVSVGVSGGNFVGGGEWRWEGYDTGIIRVTKEGSYAYISPVKEGKTEITVSNRECVNQLVITVIVGERYAVDDSKAPYIYVEKNLYETTVSAGTIAVPYSVMNVSNFNANNVRLVTQSGNIGVSHDIGKGVANVSMYDAGIARFDIVYGDLSRDVYVLVRDDLDYGNIYLTTSENYVIASVGELRTLSVRLVGYDEVNSNNYTWKMESQSGGIELVGNGDTGQIYGAGEGEGTITVSHEKAPYSLKINVKVVMDKAKEQFVYVTTERNVIETITGNDGEYIYVQKVGGSVSGGSYVWSVNDQSIVELTAQNGNSARYTAKKAGVAQVTVYHTENATHKLNIIIIVKAGLNNGVYIATSNTLIVMAPGDVQRRIGVWLENGGTTQDNSKFQWSVQQNPFNADIAKAGGTVVSIVPSNEECFINANYEGTATIRVENPGIADMPLHITVYVTRNEKLAFSVNSKVIVAGDSEFVGIDIPTYEYLNDRVRVWSSDTSICEVFYTNEIVLLKGNNAGNVVVYATIDGAESEAVQLYVSVEKEIDPNTNMIAIEKSLYSLNLKSGSMIISAAVTGANITEPDNDEIQWTLNKSGVIDMFPANGVGRQVQITPRGLGTAVITITHTAVNEKYTKQIAVIVSELNQKFTIVNTDIKITGSIPQTVSCNIAGGTTKDYNEVQWVAVMQRRWDGTMLEIVRVMGSGKEVMLYPVNDGKTDVYAIYGGNMVTMKVTVENEYYFAFNIGNIFIYPGQTVQIDYTVKPKSSNVNWILNTVSSASVNETGPIVTYGDVAGVDTSGEPIRYLRVVGIREGQVQLVGMANGKIGYCNIYVQYDYLFTMGSRNNHSDKLESGANKDLPYGIPANDTKGKSDDGKSYVEYMVYPPDTYIKAMTAIDGLEIDILAPDSLTGHGRVMFTGDRELKTAVRFKHYRHRANPGDIEEPVSGSTNDTEKDVEINYNFKENVTVKPYLVRGDGEWSNVGKPAYRFQKDNETRAYGQALDQVGTTNTYTLTLGDGDRHYILLDKQYDNAVVTVNSLTTNPSSNLLPNGASAVKIDNYTVDGVSQTAIRISGGNDVINYSRVAFNKELFIDTRTKWYGDNPAVVTTYYSFADGTDANNNTIEHHPTLSIPQQTIGSWGSERQWFGTGTRFSASEHNGISEVWDQYTVPNPGGESNNVRFLKPVDNGHTQDSEDSTEVTLYGLRSDQQGTANAIKHSSKAIRVGDNYSFGDYSTYDLNGYPGNLSNYTHFFVKETDSNRDETYNAWLEGNLTKVPLKRIVYAYQGSFYDAHKDEFENEKFSSYKYENYRIDVTKWYDSGLSGVDPVAIEFNVTHVSSTYYIYSYAKVVLRGGSYTREPVPSSSSSRQVSLYVYPKDFANNGVINSSIYGTMFKNGSGDSVFINFSDTFIDKATREHINATESIYNGYAISTDQYWWKKISSTSSNAEQTVSYNAFTKARSSGNENHPYITLPPTTASYNSGALKFNTNDNEYFEVNNLSSSPFYTSGGVMVNPDTNSSKKIAIGKNAMTAGKILHYTTIGGDLSDTRAAKNPANGNILAEKMDDGWSRLYVSTEYDNKWAFGDAYVDFRMRWENSARIIMPYYVLNSFPFRYEGPMGNVNAVSLSAGGGVPMPSLNQTVQTIANNTFDITISYQTFTGDISAITIKVTYEQRPSHFMYRNTTQNNPTTGKIPTDDDVNNGGWTEFTGSITSFDQLSASDTAYTLGNK